jgi:hypothetical protein
LAPPAKQVFVGRATSRTSPIVPTTSAVASWEALSTTTSSTSRLSVRWFRSDSRQRSVRSTPFHVTTTTLTDSGLTRRVQRPRSSALVRFNYSNGAPSVCHRGRAAHAKGPGPRWSQPILMFVRPRPVNLTGTIGASHAVEVRLGHRPGTTTRSDTRLNTGPAESARTQRGRRGLRCRRRCPRSRLFKRTSVA